VLLAVLTVTSFVVVRNHMRPTFWKRLQTLAYPFYLLIYLHLILVLLPSALSGSLAIAFNLLVYTALFATYTALRLRRAAVDQGERSLPCDRS
jgi:DMSO/TMAO reductase YedYZ heme-binding membrane subunit